MVRAWVLLPFLLARAADLSSVERELASGRHRAALEQLAAIPERTARWHPLASKAYDGIDDPAQAVAQAEKALALEPAKLEHHLQLAAIFLSRNTPKAALEIYSDAERMFPDAFLVHLGKGLALKELQMYDRAETELRWCLARQPGSALAFDALATIYLHLSRYRDVQDAAREFLRHNSADYRGYFFLAAGRDGELLPVGETKRLVAATLERNPNYAAAHALLGKILLREGKTAEAAASLKRAIELRPALVQAHLHLANAYRALGDSAAAAREFAIVRELKRKEQAGRPALRYGRGTR